SIGLRHPVVRGMMRVFQRIERAPLGLLVRVDNTIPLNSGLGAETAFWVAGMIGANNLMGNPLDRETVLKMAAEASQQPGHVIAAIHGGLTASAFTGDKLVYRSLPVAALRLVVALPDAESYAADTEAVVPERVLLADALH